MIDYLYLPATPTLKYPDYKLMIDEQIFFLLFINFAKYHEECFDFHEKKSFLLQAKNFSTDMATPKISFTSWS